MTDKLDAATIRELLANATSDEWVVVEGGEADDWGVGIKLPLSHRPQNMAIAQMLWSYDAPLIAAAPAIARYALELSDKVDEMTKFDARRDVDAEQVANELDEARAQLQSQAAELEELRECDKCDLCEDHHE